MTSTPAKAVSMRRAPQQERGRQRVDSILDAAAEIFAEVGYEAATTNAIAARAKTSIGSLYQFFPDKQAIFRALDARYCLQLHALGAQVLTPAMAAVALERMVGDVIDAYGDFQSQPGFRAVMLQHQLTPHLCEAEDESLDRELVKVLATLLSMRNPALEPERCELLADVCVRTGCTLLTAGVLGDEKYHRQMLEQTKNILVAYLRPYDAPRP
ncbi:TetR/AcrR family transcriptional regulator [Gloeobacter violaceus]|uniref:TetR family transcriptional regulatory protein n=1 Tax=Gloeobacter violaceus (strain ATCC 29082 / PCC 7421) TaxID=251221 RepID=Q7NMG2_GLOVI|nr:TetR/AcrR family transcriptional regulator [Gloeobacter violaceus]BAC88745.1 TetR family transcriptional regulatory protein [Gloeobacter violaceus PCC 7421]